MCHNSLSLAGKNTSYSVFLIQYFLSIGQCNYNMPELVAASTFLLKPGEHTWGLNSVNDNVNWTNAAFQKAKTGTDPSK